MCVMDFTGDRVLVTGGSRGIGRACALGFAQRGARVVVNFLENTTAAEKTLADLAGDGHVAIQADITDSEAVEGLVSSTIERLGDLDIVVNNAGIWVEHVIEDVSYSQWLDAWHRTLQANLIGPANVSFCAARHMIDHGGGRIVNISSRTAFRGQPDGPAYAASKAGLNALSQSLAVRLAPHGIFVGAVAPGFVETDLTAPFLDGPLGDAIRAQSPLGRVARPEEVAAAVLFLASRASEFCTGTIIDVNGASYLRT
jgi:NAD(P)-dependent dehydrogenase (short-subunit alcohol dehydrogenase family)